MPHYIGGLAHELGHAFGLPHERERPSDVTRKGKSIMGGDSQTYGRERRGEGPGRFLTAAAALPLSLHSLFTGRPRARETLSLELSELSAAPKRGRLLLRGRLESEPRAVGMVVYNDPTDDPRQYDTQGWPCRVDTEGRFQVVVEDLRPGDYGLRIRAYSQNGHWEQFVYQYQVNRYRYPDVRKLYVSPLLQEALAAYRAKATDLLADLAGKAKKLPTVNEELVRKIEHLRQLLLPRKLVLLADVPMKVKTIHVADLEFQSATVGWGSPLRNQVRPERDATVLLQVGGTFFESGLYAHAPARHVVKLDRKWRTLATGFGLQDGHDGSVVFVVKGDGRELFRSQPIVDHKVRQQAINVRGVVLLELIVENAGDGGRGDWGVWLAPTLRK